MGISLTLPLLVLMGFALTAGGLLGGAVIAPCLSPARRRTAIWLNVIGLVCFVSSLMFLSSLPPRHPDDVVSAWELIGFALTLAAFFFAVEGVVLLLHWSWCQWRAKRFENKNN